MYGFIEATGDGKFTIKIAHTADDVEFDQNELRFSEGTLSEIKEDADSRRGIYFIFKLHERDTGDLAAFIDSNKPLKGGN